jgi:predicted component of type VI protein secretion system
MPFFNKFISTEKRRISDENHEDIIQNLNNILNTKKNYGSVLDNFGIRDLNEFYDKEGIIKVVIEEVCKNIEKFEPRIDIVNITNKDSKNIFQLAFTLECRIINTKKSLDMVFDTVFNSFSIQ